VKSLALQLLDRIDSHISVNLLEYDVLWLLGRARKGFTGLHFVAYLGVDEIAEALLDMRDWDVDRADSWGRTPLIWACKNGHEGIIRLLLEKGRASIDTKDTMYGQAPLSWAAKYGMEGAANLLLQRAAVFPRIQFVRLFPKTGRTPYYLPLPGTDAGLQSVLTCDRDRRPGVKYADFEQRKLFIG